MWVFHANPHTLRCKLFCFSLAHILLLALTSAATLPHPISLALALASANATTTDSISTANDSSKLNLDATFQIYPIFSGPPLDTNAVLMSGVQFMARQAVEDINGELAQTYWHSPDPRYARIGIFVLPAHHGDTVNRRMLIWGLDMGLRYMMDHNRFASVTFRMIRDGDNVGSIDFALLPEGQPGLSLEGVASGIEQRKDDVDHASDKVNASLALNAVDARVYCRLCGYDLEAFEVFRPIVITLRGAAEYLPRYRIRSFKTPTEIGNTGLGFVDEMRQSPPYFETQFLIKAAVAVPQYMLDKGSFSETEIRINVDGTLVATGLLKIVRSPPPSPQRRKKKSMCIIS